MSDFIDFYGKNEIDFRVLSVTKLAGGLCFQIIPRQQDQLDFSNSLVVDEVAFSVVESIFLENVPFSHWGETVIQINRVDDLIKKLMLLHDHLDDMGCRSLNDICTHEINSKKAKYYPMIQTMITVLSDALQNYKFGGYTAICVLGV